MFWDRYDNYDPFFSMAPQRQPRRPTRVVRPTSNYYDDDMLDMSSWPFVRQPARKARPATRPRAPVRAKPRRREVSLEEAEEAATVLQSAFRTHLVQKHNVLPNLRALAKSQQSVEDSLRRFTAKLSNKTRTADQTRLCYATFAEELTREMLRLDQITTHNEMVVREKRKALVRKIQTLLSEVDRELPKWEKLAEEELAERRRKQEAQRRAEEEEARERAAEEERLRHIQVQTSDDEVFSDADEDVEMCDSSLADHLVRADDDSDDEYESYDEYDSEVEMDGMQVEGESPMPERASKIMQELQHLQEEAEIIEKEHERLMDALGQCELKRDANSVRQNRLREELEDFGWMDGRA